MAKLTKSDGPIHEFFQSLGLLVRTGLNREDYGIIPIPVFGQDYQTAVSLGLSTTTSATFQDKVSLVTPALTGTYRVGWHAVVQQSNASDAVQAQLANITDGGLLGVIHEHEPKDTRNRIAVGGFGEVVFTGASKTFTIQYREQRGSTAGIEDARIEIWRVA